MAKSGKVVQLFQKPENFIKTRARELQLGNCYINFDWEESGIASALVSRKHTNGNVTLSFYLIDLKCLGIKDTFFKFNVAVEEMFDLVDQMNGVEIEYEKIHNIIYGAEAFANDCGFKPHKDWTITQFILAEDDDNIPLIDIEFGEGGVPAFYVGPYDSPAKVNQILSTLDKNVGTDNYLFYNLEDKFEDDDEFEMEEGLHDILQGRKDLSLKQRFFISAGAYINVVRKQNRATLDEHRLLEILNTMVVPHNFSVDEALDNEIADCVDDYAIVFDEKSEENLEDVKQLLVENASNPYLYAELFLQYKQARLKDEADAIVKEGMERFPDFLYLRFFVAHAALIDGDIEKGFKLLNRQHYINQAFPDRRAFCDGEYMFFYSALCEYFLLRGDIDDALVCADLLVDDMHIYGCNELAIYHVCEAIDHLAEN